MATRTQIELRLGSVEGEIQDLEDRLDELNFEKDRLISALQEYEIEEDQ